MYGSLRLDRASTDHTFELLLVLVLVLLRGGLGGYRGIAFLLLLGRLEGCTRQLVNGDLLVHFGCNRSWLSWLLCFFRLYCLDLLHYGLLKGMLIFTSKFIIECKNEIISVTLVIQPKIRGAGFLKTETKAR